MTPEELQQLKRDVESLKEWKRQRELVQLTHPVDDTSKNNIGAVIDEGTGTTALTQTYTDSNNDTHTGPKAYADTEILRIGGKRMEIPVIAYL